MVNRGGLEIPCHHISFEHTQMSLPWHLSALATVLMLCWQHCKLFQSQGHIHLLSGISNVTGHEWW